MKRSPVPRPVLAALFIGASLAAGGCSLFRESQPPVPRAANVDIARYSGPWYIIGAIPLPVVETGAHNPVETYTLNPDGSIATVFQFRKAAFTGELVTKVTHATIDENTHNAQWHVRTIWPLKQQYVVSYLEPDYSSAIVARDSRDYVWILSRSPRLSDARMADYRGRIAALGYDMSKFKVFPQNGAKPSS